jgi:uncharacterized protein (TIGR02266 family)
MAQDTRKDPRAKVLTMTVRYKSATLDEFIENHSHDVSRGGMFIKTPSPFPPGTLLKFEVKIAGEQRLIQGVGRVVWRRDTSDSATERPAGMGIKFIKLDDKSKQVIESLVEKRRDEDSTFELGAKGPVSGAPARTPERQVADDAPTQMVFPEGPSNPPLPEDRTMVKQAAELLQEALREAGGSIHDIEEAPPKKQPAEPEPAHRIPKQSAKEKAVPADAAAAKPKAQAAPTPEPESPAQRTEGARRVATPARAAQTAERGGGGGRAIAILLALGVAVAVVYFFMQRQPKAPPPTVSAQPTAEQQPPETAKPEEAVPTSAPEPAASVAASDAAAVDAGTPDAAAETQAEAAKPKATPEVKPEKAAAVKPAPVAPKAAWWMAKPKPKAPAGSDAGTAEATPPPAPESAPEPAPGPAPTSAPPSGPAPAPTPTPEPPAAGTEPKHGPAPGAPAEMNPY